MDTGPEVKTMLSSSGDKAPRETTLQKCITGLSDIRFYTASLTLAMFSFTLTWGYFLASITTIEKRFGFGSTEAGLILGCYELGHLSIALFISHFGNRVHIPRLMFLSFLIIGLCCTVLALPHFFLGPLNLGLDPVTGNASSFSSIGEICISDSSTLAQSRMIGDSCADNHTGSVSGPTNYALPAIIFMIMGMAGTPMSCLAVAYIDNNAAARRSPLYVGICFAAMSLGPTAGFFLGAWCLLIFEDLSEPAITPDHPRWIGAWWLGLIIAGSLQILSSVPLLFVTKGKRKEKDLSSGGEKTKAEADVYTCRGLLNAVLRIIRNPVFICLTLSGTCAVYTVAGFFSFFPKYFETQYGVPAWRASSIAGLVSGFAGGVGSIVGGAIVTKFKLRFRATLVMCMISIAVSVVAMLSGMFIRCDNIELVTSNSTLKGVNSGCLEKCDCSDKEYYPVCDPGTRISYFSPCLAGCQSHELTPVTGEQIYTSCSCTSDGIATLGLCSRECAVLIPYSIIFAVFTFTQGLVTAPGVIVTMRCVKKTDKALAVGIAGCIVSLLGWIVAPSVYGIVIDSACELWQSTCRSGDTGSCWVYNSDDYRLKFHGLTLGFVVACFVFFFLAFKFSHGKNFDDNEEETTSPGSPPCSSNHQNDSDCFTADCCDSLCQGQREAVPLQEVQTKNATVI